MSTPFGAILPVYNAEHSLAEGVADILEVLPEWAIRFELVIIDDGSTDDTAELALELAARYPQVRVVRHPVRLGLAEAIQTGLDHGAGQIILIGNAAYELDPTDLRTLWRLRDTERQLIKQGESILPIRGARVQQLSAEELSFARLCQQLGFQMLHRATFEQYQLAHAIDTIARVDVAARASEPAGTPRPKFTARLKRRAPR